MKPQCLDCFHLSNESFICLLQKDHGGYHSAASIFKMDDGKLVTWEMRWFTV